MKRRSDRSSRLRWEVLGPITFVVLLVGFLIGLLVGWLVW